jgi:NAD(P)-dependent dehydrogenase (short-subunit alcohol dehydrogenase family)
MQIENSTCVVTGGSTGIGYAICHALGERGARITFCGVNEGRLREARDRLAEDGIDVAAVPCDVRDEASVASFAKQVRGPVDVLVNNAGLAHFAPLTDLTIEQYDETMAVNVRGMFLVTKAFLPAMLSRGSGNIVNVASLAGRNGFVGGTAYTASKHAVLGFSKSLMLEVRKQGVRVMAVCPGSVDTPFFDRAGVERDNLDRVLRPEDVAATILANLELPERALVSELDIRPANP